MIITAKIRLFPTKEQARFLLETIRSANTICNNLSDYAWENKVFKQFELHKERYYPIKEICSLSSQVIVRCISKVADAYKIDKDCKRVFRLLGAIAYDDRILRYYQDKKQVSIWTVGGRQTINYIGGEHNERLLVYRKGESDLFYTKGKFFLLPSCEIPDDETETPEDILGVDLGIKNLATDSDGQVFSGENIEHSRQWYNNRRTVLQSIGTKSAKRRLKKLSGKQKNFQSNTNHIISKQLVTKAKDTKRALVLEELTHIRNRTQKRLRKTQRNKHSNWGFGQLRQFITYKAGILGVSIVVVNPAYTSRTCHQCGHCEKANRKSQSDFLCRSCGHSTNADKNAALNIKELGRINSPMVSTSFGG